MRIFLAYFIVSHPSKNYLHCLSVNGNQHNFLVRNQKLWVGRSRFILWQSEVDIDILAIGLVIFVQK